VCYYAASRENFLDTFRDKLSVLLQEKIKDKKTLEHGADRLSRNVGKVNTSKGQKHL